MLKKTIEQLYRLLVKIGNAFQHVILLIFRLHWGYLYFVTGKAKFANHESVTEFFTSLGIPVPGLNAWFVAGVECFGGIFLLLGLCSRPVALVLSINMLVAYLSVEADRATITNILNDAIPFLHAEPFWYFFTAVLIFAFGPGKISLDYLICKFFCKKENV